MLCLCLEWRSRRILERSDQSLGDFSETAPRFIKGEFARTVDQGQEHMVVFVTRLCVIFNLRQRDFENSAGVCRELFVLVTKFFHIANRQGGKGGHAGILHIRFSRHDAMHIVNVTYKRFVPVELAP